MRLHEIDGLRAVAAILVVIHHFATSSIVALVSGAGYGRVANAISLTTNSGVELFFVLSGVVLLRPFLRGTRAFRALPYFRRRAERLWPPYLAALGIASGVVFLATLHPTWYSRHILPVFTIRGSIRQAGIVNLGWPIYNLAWWSLTPELVFYALAPVVVALFAMRGLRRPALFAIIGVATLLSALQWNVTTSMPGVQSGFANVGLQFLAYLPCFMVGTMIAKVDLDARDAWRMLATGTVYFFIALNVQWANIHAAYGLIYGAVVSLAMCRGSLLNRFLTRPIAVWLGERSYSLFLVHFSILYLGDYLASLVFPDRSIAYGFSSRVFGLVFSFLAAMTIFSLIERRFARGLTTADSFWPWKLARAQETVVSGSTINGVSVSPG